MALDMSTMISALSQSLGTHGVQHVCQAGLSSSPHCAPWEPSATHPTLSTVLCWEDFGLLAITKSHGQDNLQLKCC